jgi:hypothetical protein
MVITGHLRRGRTPLPLAAVDALLLWCLLVTLLLWRVGWG